tara:strand:+ start:1648 stop:1968 length:321 start_codon:yes stop_codon:yes gene_type:complete
MEHATELSAAGILVCMILNLVFNFLEKSRMKKSGIGAVEKLAEIHHVLLAPPPQESLLSVIRELQTAAIAGAYNQRETVKVLKEIRDVLASHGDKLDAAKCEQKKT